MKKYIVLGIGLWAVWLSLSYHSRQVAAREAQLVEDAYYGALVEVKNAVEQGVSLAATLTFEDPQREYYRQTFTVLQAAASGGNEDVILFLLDQQLDINQPTAQGWTPLFIAARDGRVEAAKLLVFKGANLDLQTNLGTTALTMVVTQPYPTEQDRLNLLEYMLKRGANPNVQDVYHHTPLYYALAQKKEAVAQLLKTYNAHP